MRRTLSRISGQSSPSGTLTGSCIGFDIVGRKSRPGYGAMQLCLRKVAAHDFADLEKLFDIDAGFEPHRIEHEYQVVHDDVAARAGGERAAAEPRERGVEAAHADVQRG